MCKNDKDQMMTNGSNGNNGKGKGGKFLFVNYEDIQKFEQVLDEYAYLKIKVNKLENENAILKNGIIKIRSLIIKKDNNNYM